MLHFKSLRWRNFLSTGNYWTEVNLNKTQNTLVVGQNGSGKSTLLDALCFSLYNTPFRDINKGALVNSINTKDTLVEVEFRADNHEYKVVRGIKPDVFEIYRDGVLKDQTASVDYQGDLEQTILKLNYKSFTQIVILGTAGFTPFMQLKASDRREVIEDLLDIQIFSRMNKLLKTWMSENLNARLLNKAAIVAELEKISMQERYIIEAQQDVNAQIRSIEQEKLHNNLEVARLNEEIAIHRSDSQELIVQIKDKAKITNALKKLTQLESQIENAITRHHKTANFYATETKCPTCGQVIDKIFKQSQYEDLNNKIDECTTGLGQLNEKVMSAQTQLSAFFKIEALISDNERHIATAETSIREIEKFNAKSNTRLHALSTHTTPLVNQSRLEEYKLELTRLEQDKKDLLETAAYHEAAGTLLKDTGIKTKIIRQYLPIINTLVNKYLAGMDFFVNFNLDETFKETIKSRHRDEFTYHSFSEGEKQRIDMALVLTWRAVAKLKNSAATNLLILDEIFDSSLDNTGTEELMKILHNLEATNVFVISHRGDLLQDKFQNVVRFSRQQNFSRIG